MRLRILGIGKLGNWALQYATGDQSESAKQEGELAVAKAALAATETNIATYSAKQAAAEGLLETLTAGMGNAVKLVGCEGELGAEGVTQRNLMQVRPTSLRAPASPYESQARGVEITWGRFMEEGVTPPLYLSTEWIR